MAGEFSLSKRTVASAFFASASRDAPAAAARRAPPSTGESGDGDGTSSGGRSVRGSGASTRTGEPGLCDRTNASVGAFGSGVRDGVGIVLERSDGRPEARAFFAVDGRAGVGAAASAGGGGGSSAIAAPAALRTCSNRS